MIERLNHGSDDVLGFKLTGTLHDEDYDRLVPVIDRALQERPKVRLLAWFHDFQGWTATALWDDIAFDATHAKKFERIALVGEKAWQEWMTAVCKPFTSATVKFFDVHEIDDAWAWVEAT